jgi:hypothetical protein
MLVIAHRTSVVRGDLGVGLSPGRGLVERARPGECPGLQDEVAATARWSDQSGAGVFMIASMTASWVPGEVVVDRAGRVRPAGDERERGDPLGVAEGEQLGDPAAGRHPGDVGAFGRGRIEHAGRVVGEVGEGVAGLARRVGLRAAGVTDVVTDHPPYAGHQPLAQLAGPAQHRRPDQQYSRVAGAALHLHADRRSIDHEHALIPRHEALLPGTPRTDVLKARPSGPPELIGGPAALRGPYPPRDSPVPRELIARWSSGLRQYRQICMGGGPLAIRPTER